MFLDDAQTNSAKEGFRALNTNRDGSIAVRELRQALALRFDVQISECAAAPHPPTPAGLRDRRLRATTAALSQSPR